MVSKKQVEQALHDASGPVAVVFLSARCPCSQSHEARLRELAAKFPRVRFVGVHSNVDESAELAREHFQSAQLPFPVIQDEHSRWANAFGALKTPHVFLLGAGGEILFQGGVDDSHIASQAKTHYLEEALGAVSSGKKPERSSARTLGCVIRRE